MAYANDVLYGAEYEVGGSREPSGLGNLHDKDIPCAVCRRRGKSSVFMIPGKCYFIHINCVSQKEIVVLLCITCLP